MPNNFLSKFSLFFITVFLSVSLYAEGNNTKSLYDDSYVVLDAGLFLHYFTESDEFRKASGLFGDDDKIDYLLGLVFDAELLLNKTFSLNLPVNLGVGYKFQTMSNTVEYSTTMGYEIEKKVEIMNNIGFMNVYIPLDPVKYLLLGGSVGVGASKYSLSWEYENPSINDSNDSSYGIVIPLSVFLDWGTSGLGGRVGYTYVLSKYSDINGSTPNGDGSQIFIDIRYSI